MPLQDNVVLQPVEQILADNNAALVFLGQVKAAAALPGVKPFGPVLITDPTAAERLELLMRVGQTDQIQQGIIEVVNVAEKEGLDPLGLFRFARDLQETLGGETTCARRWRNYVIPSFLQMPTTRAAEDLRSSRSCSCRCGCLYLAPGVAGSGGMAGAVGAVSY